LRHCLAMVDAYCSWVNDNNAEAKDAN
jgi:hypothetical protein